jgi:histidinol-phosphate aminotransferase
MSAPAPPWLARALHGLSPPPSVPPAADTDQVLLNLNESPWPPSPRAIEAADAATRRANRYPAQGSDALTMALAARTGTDPALVALAGGSDMILHQACLMALEPGTSCVFPRPSFPRYRLSTAIAGARGIAIDVTSDGLNDVAAMLAAVAADTRLVFACTPNGNTGAMLDADAIAALARDVPGDVLLCVDEAYVEFGRAAGGPDALDVLRAHRRGPWLVSRTFSKAYALAGMRIGYALCSDATVAHGFAVARPSFAVGGPAIAAAAAALEDQTHLETILHNTAAGAAQLAAGMRALGLKPFPSVANFVSADLGRPVGPVLAVMQAHGVLARGFREPGWDNHLRITVGLPAENDRALRALQAALAADEKGMAA